MSSRLNLLERFGETDSLGKNTRETCDGTVESERERERETERNAKVSELNGIGKEGRESCCHAGTWVILSAETHHVTKESVLCYWCFVSFRCGMNEKSEEE